MSTMRHFPTDRAVVRISGLEHTRAPRSYSLTTITLFALVMFTAGAILGAFAFGTALVNDTDAQLRAQSEAAR